MPSRRASSKSGRVSGPGHLALEEGVDLPLILHPPAGEEGGERQLGKHHQLAAARVRLAQQAEEALDHVGARLAPRDGPELGGADGEDAGHQATGAAARDRVRSSRR